MEDTNFDDFFGAYDGEADIDEGNQSDADIQEEATEEAQQEQPQEEQPSEDTGEGSAPGSGEEQAEKKPEEASEQPAQEQKFTLRWNKQDKVVGVNEMTELAQKGLDYDRIKGKLETVQADLQKNLDEQAPIFEALKIASETSGIPIENLIENVQVGVLKAQGMSEREAKAEIRASRAERKAKALESPGKDDTAQDTQAEDTNSRASREIAEFRDTFPGVQLTEELVNKLAADVQGGMTLTNAYYKLENTRLQAELAEQKRQAAAQAQNEKNKRTAAPGQNDTGGGREKDAFDDFFSALDK